MLKLARWSTTHRKYVLLGWIALVIGVTAGDAPAAQPAPGRPSGGPST